MRILTENELRKKKPKSGLIGGKAAGLLSIPRPWRPPLIVVPCPEFENWAASSRAAKIEYMNSLVGKIQNSTQSWQKNWPRGLIVRSSAVNEGLNDRGTWISLSLPADYGEKLLHTAVAEIYENFIPVNTSPSIALVIQPLAPMIFEGHISNERRVSASINQWEMELSKSNNAKVRFNSQRGKPPKETTSLSFGPDNDLMHLFKGLGKWCTELDRGPVHIEFGTSTEKLWILQIDFEDEADDDGTDPRKTIREHDFTPSSVLPSGSLLTRVDKRKSRTGWRKLDNTGLLRKFHKGNFPDLYYITGDRLLAYGRKTKKLHKEINQITRGRAMCRTDCTSKKIAQLNLPRTPTVTPQAAAKFMKSTLRDLIKQGARSQEICFILHRFIPAQSAAWARADPTSQLVHIDSLWGVPDGLQYLTHDSFEFDIKRNKSSSKRPRYKPTFIQEAEDGSWETVKIERRKARHASLKESDLREIAAATHAIASSTNEPTLVMWFCGISDNVGVGRNLPWFRMPARSEHDAIGVTPAQYDRLTIRNESDLDDLNLSLLGHTLLSLDPELNLYRQDEKFLLRVINVANEFGFPVEISGSKLAHAYYQLERAGVIVVSSDMPHHSRVRGKQVFQKLVRDDIPERIRAGGEKTVVAQIAKSESRSALIIKLFEEALELKNATSPNDVVAELADLLEVVKSMAEATGVDWAEVNETADKKKAKRGSFNRGVVLMETGWPKEGRQKEGGPKLISLRELAGPIELIKGASGANFSFAHLLADEAPKTVDVGGGFMLRIELTDNGISVRIESRPDDNQLQFDLSADKDQ